MHHYCDITVESDTCATVMESDTSVTMMDSDTNWCDSNVVTPL